MTDARQPFPRGIFCASSGGTTIPAGSRLVLAALWSFARWWEAGDPWVYPTAATLARTTGQHPRSVWKQLSTLTEVGLVRRERRSVAGGGRFEGWLLVRPPDPIDDDAPQVLLEVEDVSFYPAPGGTLDMEHPAPGGSATLPPGAVPPCPVGDGTLPPGADRRVTEESLEESLEENTAPAGPAARLASDVIDYMRQRCRELDPSERGPRDTPGNRRMIAAASKRENATIDDWRHVIDAQFASVRPDPNAWRYLCLSTLSRPNNFARLRDAPKSNGKGRTSQHAPSLFEHYATEPCLDGSDEHLGDFPL